MTPTISVSRIPEAIPEAIPVEIEPPRIATYPPRAVEPPSEDGNGLRPLQYLKYRWATVLFLGGLVGAVFAFAAYSLIPAKYTTSAIIRVSPQDPRIYYNEDAHGRGDFASYLKTQAGAMRSHFVLNAAIRDPEVAALPMLRAQIDPVRFLEEEIQVEYQDGSELIKLKLSGDDPRAITMIINATHDAFFREVVEAERLSKQERLKVIRDSITRMQTDLEKKFSAVKKDPAEEAPTETLPGVGPSVAAGQVNRLRERLDLIEGQQRKFTDDKQRLVQKLAHPDAELPPAPPGYAAALDNDPAIASINRQVGRWQMQMKHLLELNSDENNPGVKELKGKIAEAAQDRERIRKERIEEVRRSQLDETVRRMKADVERIDAELETLKFSHERTTKSIKEYESKLVAILPNAKSPDFGTVDTQTRSSIISGMMEKANLLDLELKAPTRVKPFQKAAVPMKRESKKQLLGTAAGVLLGFMLVGLGVVAYESRIKRTMTVADVHQATLCPILGAIPAVLSPTGQPTGDLALAEEAIEKTRANLLQQFGHPAHKIIVLTSAIADEGRTFLVRELVLSFARAGERVLLIDGDLRTPTMHTLLDVPNEVGLCEVLTGQASFADAAKVLPWGMAILPAGHWNDQVRPWLSVERVTQLFAGLREQFDWVLVNTHPLLSVAETTTLARASDGVVLTVEKFESRLPLVSKAQEKLAALAPEALGVVVLNAAHDECLHG